MKKLFMLWLTIFSLPLFAQWGGWSGWGDWASSPEEIIPTKGLKLLVDPGRQIIANSPQNPQKPYAPLQYGSELVDNGDFHNFINTDVASANNVAFWVFDDYYHTNEGTGKTAIQDLVGTHNLTASAGFDWQNQFTGTNPAYENGRALSFDGVDDYFYIPSANAGDFNPGTGDFSITVTFSYDTVNGIRQYILGKGANTGIGSFSYACWITESGNFRINITTASANWINFDVGGFSPGNFYTVTLTADRDGAQNLYRNGTLIASQSVANSEDISVIDLFKISLPTGGTQTYFKGKITQVAYYNKALTEQEVKELYGLAKGWTWDGVGSISNNNFQQVVSGGGTVSQQVVTTSGNLYEKNVDGTISYLNENNYTVNLTDGTHTLASVRQVSNASWNGTTVLDYFFPPQENGTMQGLMEQNQPAYPYALKFDGVDDYVSFGNVLNIGTNNFETSFYVKSTSFANKYFLSKYQDANNYFYIGTNASNQIVCKAVQAGATVFEYRSNTALTDNVYNFITVSKDNSGITFAINGVDAGATVVTALQPTAVQNSGIFYLGRYNTVYFAGEIGINTLHFANGAASQIYNNTKHLYQ